MKRRLSWGAVGWWLLLTFVGLALAGGLHFPGGYGTNVWREARLEDPVPLLGFLFGVVSGLFIAGLQALVLRAWGGPARQWVLLNALAFGLVHAVADGLPYRPLVAFGGGPVVALCQYLALRRSLTRPWAWLPLVAAAWWLAFGLTQGPYDYNLPAVLLALGGATGLGLRWLFVPGPRRGMWPAAWRERWARLSAGQRGLLLAVSGLGLAACMLAFTVMTGLVPLP
ncbi:MAG: hypothetical protein IT317_10970 [Anaerolineales bacterium]|nr:hypothetical protein [Anaerolineales bacterium]